MLESLIHHYCIYFRDNRMEYGWIEGLQKNKLIVNPVHGKNQFLPENRIAFSWSDKKIPDNSVQAHDALALHLNNADQFKQNCELETMHSLLEAERDYSLDELASDFLDDPDNQISKLGLFLSLRDDHYWFKQNRNLTYTPRTTEELEVLQIQLARQHERQKRAENIQKWIHQLESGLWNAETNISAEQNILLDQLLNLLAEGVESPFWKEFSSQLEWGNYLGLAEENSLKRWLASAGVPISPGRLTLLRAKVREYFPENVLAETARLKKYPQQTIEIIGDQIPTFTIDAEKTLDYDDAFSVFEWSNGGLLIAVHITDLSFAVHSEEPLFKEAEARLSSVYSLEKTISMFPEVLANDTFSLRAGENRTVLSFYFQLSGNGDFKLMDVANKVICVQDNLSYERADQLIEKGNEFWRLLHNFCLRAQEQRIEKGALNLARKEFGFDISDPKNISIKPLNRNSPANRIIEELAIAVNRETARLFHDADFPGIYRTQSAYELIKEVDEGQPVSLENIRIEPARLTTVCGEHYGLGCDYYMQVTSPIRRFVDLITQQQLKNLINKKEPLFSTEDMMHWAEDITVRQKKYNRAEKDIIKYWKLRYLQQHLGELFEAKIRKINSNNTTDILLLDLDLIIQATGLKEQTETELLLLKILEVSIGPNRIVVQTQTTSTESSVHRL